MNKMKDLFYNISDVLVALLIVVVALVIITVRIDSIMAYPETLVSNAYENVNRNDEPSLPAISDTPDVTTTGGGVETGADEVEMYSVYINYGESIQIIGEKFVSVGLFDSTEQFVQTVNDMSASTKIKSGTFIMPATSTPEEVIGIITKPGL